MALFGALMGDLEEDPIFGAHMRQMRQMNTMMNSLFNFGDPFGGMMGGMGGMGQIQAQMQPPQMFGRQLMPMFSQNMSNRLLNAADMSGGNPGVGFQSSSVFSMTTGPDGKPQVYKATSSTKAGPGGIRETRKTLEDSRTGTKKMSIGHHIGERAHVIEKAQDLRTGQLEENEELINLEEEEREHFDREFTQKARSLAPGGRRHGPEIQAIMPAPNQSESTVTVTDRQSPNVLAMKKTVPSSPVISSNRPRNSSLLGATPRRAIRAPASSPLAMSAKSPSPTTSVHPHPYNPASRKHRAIKSGAGYKHQQHQQHQQQPHQH